MAKIKDSLEFLAFKAVKLLLSVVSRKLCLFIGRTVGYFFYFFDKRHRYTALSNLEAALGSELSTSELKEIAKNSFKYFGEVFLDLLKLSDSSQRKLEQLITVEGEENLQNALQEGKGALLFSAHYGNWEIASFFVSKKGKLSVIARPLDNKILEKKLIQIRTNFGARVIYKHQATKQILRTLQAKEMVAILIDQNVLRSEAVFVDFFGKQAATTPSLATFFLRTKAPLLPVFCYPSSSHTYNIKILKPLEIVLKGDYNQDVLKITQLCTKIIECQIRKNPIYWFWFHN
ncbi:MAG: hypothetical protein KAX27_04370, partial [Candidatus Aminicenantes bacterium]|nr:hypothetical protein [Candidatus Aminicenantes bacterium]